MVRIVSDEKHNYEKNISDVHNIVIHAVTDIINNKSLNLSIGIGICMYI